MYAVIDNNIVVNISDTRQENVIWPAYIIEVDSANIGDVHVNGGLKSPVISRLQFLRRFTFEERSKILQSDDIVIKDALLLLNSATEVSLIDEDVIRLLDYLVTKDILSEQRKGELLRVS